VRFILSVTLAAAALVAAAVSSGPAAADVTHPTTAAIARDSSFADTTFSRTKSAAVLPDAWPFAPVASTGETVEIHLSKKLFTSTDTAVAQQWADFFGSLVHGSELSTLDAYFVTLSEVQSVCGRGALACYGGNQIIAPAEDPAPDLSAEAVVTHEYGHHVAAHRLNPPWDALETGTKRWATYQNVCLNTRKGLYFPGAEDEDHYYVNPGEGFAESYRVMNERLLGVLEAPWDIVSNQFYPDDNGLAVLKQDVSAPWTKATALSRTGSVTKRTPSRSYVVSTLLDGRLVVSLRSSAKAKFRLDVLSPTSTRLARATGKNASASATVCGARALRVRVTRVTGAGPFRLAISRP
jgi:hypothetical protein